MEEMVEKSSQTFAPTLDIDGEVLADAGADEVLAYLRDKGLI